MPSPQFDQILTNCSLGRFWVLSVLDPPDVCSVNVGVALQCHAPQNTINASLCTLRDSPSHVLVLVSQWAHAPQSPF